jgi:hypothetical protein
MLMNYAHGALIETGFIDAESLARMCDELGVEFPSDDADYFAVVAPTNDEQAFFAATERGRHLPASLIEGAHVVADEHGFPAIEWHYWCSEQCHDEHQSLFAFSGLVEPTYH